MLDKIKQGAAKVFKTLTDTCGRHLTPAAVLTINGQPFGTQAMSRIGTGRGRHSDGCNAGLPSFQSALRPDGRICRRRRRSALRDSSPKSTAKNGW